MIAKLAGFFPYSWLWVLAPMGIGFVLFLIVMVLVVLAAVVSA